MPKIERLGIVSYTNVAPLHFGLETWPSVEFVRGVPSQLNKQLLNHEIDLTLISSIEFIKHAADLKALPDFSISTLGKVFSVILFSKKPWQGLENSTIAITTQSATSVELLRILLREKGISAELVPLEASLEEMLAAHSAALLIGDNALIEATKDHKHYIYDLGEEWYKLTKLPFTFAVWASHKNNKPSKILVEKLRQARIAGLGNLEKVSEQESKKLNLDRTIIQKYLANFRYYLDLPDRDGLVKFAQKAVVGLELDRLEYWDI